MALGESSECCPTADAHPGGGLASLKLLHPILLSAHARLPEALGALSPGVQGSGAVCLREGVAVMSFGGIIIPWKRFLAPFVTRSLPERNRGSGT